jgi:hypothetical protein
MKVMCVVPDFTELVNGGLMTCFFRILYKQGELIPDLTNRSSLFRQLINSPNEFIFLTMCG